MMMRAVLATMAALAAMALAPATVLACHERPRCQVGGAATVTYVCDVCEATVADCDGSGGDECGRLRCQTNTAVVCDDDADCPSGDHCMLDHSDGVIVRCGTSGADDISGTSSAEVLCGFGGNDVLDGAGGADILAGGGGDDELIGGSGDDTLWGDGTDGTAGNDTFDGGTGDDFIVGNSSGPGVGDDEVLAGDGDDIVITGSGRDVLKGGDGDDMLWTAVYGMSTFPDNVVGTLICGGTGDDNLLGWGPSHQCMDGGPDTDTCSYSYFSSGTDSDEDLGTARGCESGGTTYQPSCGCD